MSNTSLFSRIRRLLADISRFILGATSREARLEQSLVDQGVRVVELMTERNEVANQACELANERNAYQQFTGGVCDTYRKSAKIAVSPDDSWADHTLGRRICHYFEALSENHLARATRIDGQERELMAARDSLHSAERLAFLVPNLKEHIRELDSLGERWQAERDDARSELKHTKQLLLDAEKHAANVVTQRDSAISERDQAWKAFNDRESEFKAELATATQYGANMNADLNFARGEIEKLANEKAQLIAKLDRLEDGNYVSQFNKMSREIHEWARGKGWWEERDLLSKEAMMSGGNDFNRFTNSVIQSSLIALIHSELSEALEAIRHGNPPDDKIPEFSGLEAELADTVIRIHDMAGAYGLRVGEAIEAKMAFNQTREHKHGGKAT